MIWLLCTIYNYVCSSMKTDQMNETIWRIESNLEDLQRSGLAGGSGSDAESSDPTLRADLKDLRNNFDTFKTTVNKEVEAVKTGFSVINNNLDVLSTGLQDLTTVSQLSESRSSRALEELSSLKSSVLALQELQEMDSQSKEDIDAIKNSLSEIQAKDDDNRLVLVISLNYSICITPSLNGYNATIEYNLNFR